MNSPHSSLNSSAVAWACLSQAIWLPLVAIEAHDQWKDHVREQTPPRKLVAVSPEGKAGSGAGSPGKEAVLSSLTQGAPRQITTGIVLGTALAGRDPLLNDPIERSIDRSSSGPLAMMSPPRRIAPAVLGGSPIPLPPRAAPGFSAGVSDRPLAESLLQRSFTKAELLGGPITLSEPDTVRMPALARAERARWASSSDPLAPLPEIWRTPMRRAIEQLPSPSTGTTPAGRPRIQVARVVHVPSSRVSRPTDVPVALQSDGTVDILSKPEDPAVVEEISSWSSRQEAPSRGSVTPAVVHLHPLPDAPAPPVASVQPPVAAPALDSPAPTPPAAIPSPPPPTDPSPPEPVLP